MIRYAKPTTVEEALGLLSADRWRILAGGTDFYPAQGARPIRENVLDLNGLSQLRGLRETPTHHVIGARTTWTDIVRADLPPSFDALKQAAYEVGSVQIQNVGTIAGNLCNASPAADGVPPLLVLDAEVELRSATATRRLALSQFLLGNRQTMLAPHEVLSALHIPKRTAGGSSAFRKLGARRYLVISIAMVAARIEVDADERIVDASVAVGSCSTVAQRLRGLEAALIGQPAGGDLALVVAAADLPELAPISDVRGTAEYRLEAARETISHVVIQAAHPAPGRARAA